LWRLASGAASAFMRLLAEARMLGMGPTLPHHPRRLAYVKLPSRYEGLPYYDAAILLDATKVSHTHVPIWIVPLVKTKLSREQLDLRSLVALPHAYFRDYKHPPSTARKLMRTEGPSASTIRCHLPKVAAFSLLGLSAF
jgi:hypothetical protein